MRVRPFHVCLASLFLLAVLSAPLLAGWTVTTLTPTGYMMSTARGVDDGQQAGVAHPYTNLGYYTQYHAGMWSGSSGTWADLNPAGCSTSSALAISDGKVAGSAFGTATGNKTHAVLWNGSADNWVDLNPGGTMYVSSMAWGIHGSQQVGSVRADLYGTTYSMASLWNSTAASWVMLDGGDSAESVALATDGTQQVGAVNHRAMLWSGTAASKVSLAPANSRTSRATDIADGQQAGYAEFADAYENIVAHAGLWTGTAASWVDLHPTGALFSSHAYGVAGGWQAGSAQVWDNAQVAHAGLWHGSADTWTDLHHMLPSGYKESEAYDIEVSGDVITVAGYAVSASDGLYNSVIWTYTPVPEPSSFLVMGSGLLGLCGFLRRRK
jgi:hypothetical protein